LEEVLNDKKLHTQMTLSGRKFVVQREIGMLFIAHFGIEEVSLCAVFTFSTTAHITR